MSAIATRPVMPGTSTQPPPDRSMRQRMEALGRANRIRTTRARLKVDLKAGRSVVPLIVDPPEWLSSMKVFDLLLAAPKVGRVKASKTLRHVGISPSKTISGLSPRQRSDLLEALRAWPSVRSQVTPGEARSLCPKCGSLGWPYAVGCSNCGWNR